MEGRWEWEGSWAAAAIRGRHGERERQGGGERPHGGDGGAGAGGSQRRREQLGGGRHRGTAAVVSSGRGDAGAATARALPLRTAGEDDLSYPKSKE